MRLIVVSNRLPVIVEGKDENITFKQSAGGLVQGLSASLESLEDNPESRNYLWIGWPGTTIKEEYQKTVKKALKKNFNACPVFTSEAEMEKFYLGFCNSTLWPIFHSIPTLANYNEDFFEEYIKVNKKFKDVLIKVLKKDDIVWVHDYHLMLLPQMLRNEFKDIKIGFFLHIPFPSFEIFRLLPKNWRTEIVNGLLGADLIGFHTFSYMQNFTNAVERTTGIQSKFGNFAAGDRIVKTKAFPIGIDFDKYNDSSQKESVSKEIENLKKTFGENKVILSIDRLDYSKGITNRLRAFELFLERNPSWRKKVTLAMIVVPSRIGVYQYQETKNTIDQMIGNINGKFGNFEWTPIVYQFKNLTFEPLAALYSAGDVILVTPLIDGMNLVSKEYVAAQKDLNGVLILSECAGAAEELRNTIIVSPNDISEIADAIKKALEMTFKEKVIMNKPLQSYLKKYDIKMWAQNFIDELLTKNKGEFSKAKILDSRIKEKAIKDFAKASKSLFLLDYDGTLVNFFKKPRMAKPSDRLLQILSAISSNPKNEVVLISGRDKNSLEEWFKRININIFAEHGAYYRNKNGKWSRFLKTELNFKKEILEILQIYANRLPGALVEEKNSSVVFHYRNASENLSNDVIPELVTLFKNLLANSSIIVQNISKGIEIKSVFLNKSVAVSNYLANKEFNFILAAGDDIIDEEMFNALPNNAYSIKVGDSKTCAKYYIKSVNEMLDILNEFSKKKTAAGN